jgi:hypothetical protein
MFHVGFITSSELFLFIGSHGKFKYKPERGDYDHPLALQATGPPPTMRMNAVSSSLTLALLTGSTLAGGIYSLTENIVGDGFYDSFNFEAIPDPTNGRVYVAPTTHNVFYYLLINRTYVDQAMAQSLNLTYATSDTFIMRADDTTVLTSNGPGRNSVRIRSNNQYTQHVVVYVIRQGISDRLMY